MVHDYVIEKVQKIVNPEHEENFGIDPKNAEIEKDYRQEFHQDSEKIDKSKNVTVTAANSPKFLDNDNG